MFELNSKCQNVVKPKQLIDEVEEDPYQCDDVGEEETSTVNINSKTKKRCESQIY